MLRDEASPPLPAGLRFLGFGVSRVSRVPRVSRVSRVPRVSRVIRVQG